MLIHADLSRCETTVLVPPQGIRRDHTSTKIRRVESENHACGNTGQGPGQNTCKAHRNVETLHNAGHQLDKAE